MKIFQVNAALLTCFLLVGCGAENTPTENTAKDADTVPGTSIYQLASNWKTQHGKDLNIAELGGKVNVLAMVYTSCKAACPRIIADVQRIEMGLGDKKEEVQFVLVSMDPENDPPEKLLELAQNYQLETPNWTLLTGSVGDVLDIANVLDVRIRRGDDGKITDHSNLIFVLDKQGVIVHKQEGLSIPPEESIAAINNLLP